MFGPVWSCSPNLFGAPSSQQGRQDGRMAWRFSPNVLYALDIMVTIGQGFIDFLKGPFFSRKRKTMITSIELYWICLPHQFQDSTSMKPGRPSNPSLGITSKLGRITSKPGKMCIETLKFFMSDPKNHPPKMYVWRSLPPGGCLRPQMITSFSWMMNQLVSKRAYRQRNRFFSRCLQ